MISREDIKAITERLKQPDIEKVILFGSYAHGTPHPDSDLDLIVVTGDAKIPESFNAKIKVVTRVSRYIGDFRKKIPIDLIVYTKGMYQKLNELDSSFSREIEKTGVILYERDYQGLA